MDEAEYNKVRTVERSPLFDVTGKKSIMGYRWLIKPADRVLFAKGGFYGKYYDNGLLHLRETVPPGAVFTAGNRPPGVGYVELMGRFLTQVSENCLYQEQSVLADADEGIQLVDPDGSLSPILEKMNCPVCLDPCFAPSYICPNSHNLCGRCRDSLLKALPEGTSILCPTCRAEYNFATPYFINAAIVGQMKFKCRYTIYGCRATPSGNQVLDHTDNDCAHRPWRCYFCPLIVEVPQFADHLLSSHGRDIPLVVKQLKLPAEFKFEVPIAPLNERSRANGELIKLGCVCIKSEGWFFVLEMELQYGCSGWAVLFLGPNSSCRKYTADISLKTEYDIGGNRPHEFVTDIFLNQPILSCQNEMRVILDTIMNTDYVGGFAMKDFSRYGGAGRYNSTIDLTLRYADGVEAPDEPE